MKYFKHTELARLVGVSEKTVRNWAQLSSQNKMIFDVVENKGKIYIANTTHNVLQARKLVESNKKFHNTRTLKTVRPTENFYKTYSPDHIIDIINSLERSGELPFHYCHIGPMSRLCADYYDRLRAEPILNPQSFSSNYFTEHANDILTYFPKGQQVNVVELGGRTGLTIIDFVKIVHDKDLLNTYLNIDLSKELIEINRKNVTKAIGNKVQAIQKDILQGRFTNVLSTIRGNNNVANLVCLLGGTLNAFSDRSIALQNIQKSMGTGDYFVISTKLDSEDARRYFDFNPVFTRGVLPVKEKWLIDQLGVDQSMYDVEMFYDEKNMERKIQVRLRYDIDMLIELPDRTHILHFRKADVILLWRFAHQTLDTMMQELRDNGFKIVQAATSPDEQYGIVISRIQTDKVNHR